MARESLTTVNFLTPIEQTLFYVEERIRAQADGSHPDLDAALRHLISSGGKRVRPAVALLTGGMLGGDQERLITLGAAIELLHTATLVHDDLIDGALLRRGIATLNSSWSPAATVLTGDFIFARAAKLAAETNSVEVMRIFADTLGIIVNGEVTQLFLSKRLASRENYLQRIYAKTASMFELASTAAALLSPVDPETVALVGKFGYQIGMAFQVVDDVLDFTAEQDTLGKPVAGDLRQGLVTLPALHYLGLHPDDPAMKQILDGRMLSDEHMDRLVMSIRQSGAIETALAEAREFVDCALEILDHFPASSEKQALADLALYIVSRST